MSITSVEERANANFYVDTLQHFFQIAFHKKLAIRYTMNETIHIFHNVIRNECIQCTIVTEDKMKFTSNGIHT